MSHIARSPGGIAIAVSALVGVFGACDGEAGRRPESLTVLTAAVKQIEQNTSRTSNTIASLQCLSGMLQRDRIRAHGSQGLRCGEPGGKLYGLGISITDCGDITVMSPLKGRRPTKGSGARRHRKINGEDAKVDGEQAVLSGESPWHPRLGVTRRTVRQDDRREVVRDEIRIRAACRF